MRAGAARRKPPAPPAPGHAARHRGRPTAPTAAARPDGRHRQGVRQRRWSTSTEPAATPSQPNPSSNSTRPGSSPNSQPSPTTPTPGHSSLATTRSGRSHRAQPASRRAPPPRPPRRPARTPPRPPPPDQSAPPAIPGTSVVRMGSIVGSGRRAVPLAAICMTDHDVYNSDRAAAVVGRRCMPRRTSTVTWRLSRLPLVEHRWGDCEIDVALADDRDAAAEARQLAAWWTGSARCAWRAVSPAAATRPRADRTRPELHHVESSPAMRAYVLERFDLPPQRYHLATPPRHGPRPRRRPSTWSCGPVSARTTCPRASSTRWPAGWPRCCAVACVRWSCRTGGRSRTGHRELAIRVRETVVGERRAVLEFPDAEVLVEPATATRPPVLWQRLTADRVRPTGPRPRGTLTGSTSTYRRPWRPCRPRPALRGARVDVSSVFPQSDRCAAAPLTPGPAAGQRQAAVAASSSSTTLRAPPRPAASARAGELGPGPAQRRPSAAPCPSRRPPPRRPATGCRRLARRRCRPAAQPGSAPSQSRCCARARVARRVDREPAR